MRSREEDFDRVTRAMKFGRQRTTRVMDHCESRRAFFRRQADLAAISCVHLAFFTASYAMSLSMLAQAVFASLALLCVKAGTVEARRMRACGIYYQCNRSIEIAGI